MSILAVRVCDGCAAELRQDDPQHADKLEGWLSLDVTAGPQTMARKLHLCPDCTGPLRPLLR